MYIYFYGSVFITLVSYMWRDVNSQQIIILQISFTPVTIHVFKYLHDTSAIFQMFRVGIKETDKNLNLRLFEFFKNFFSKSLPKVYCWLTSENGHILRSHNTCIYFRLFVFYSILDLKALSAWIIMHTLCSVDYW